MHEEEKKIDEILRRLLTNVHPVFPAGYNTPATYYSRCQEKIQTPNNNKKRKPLINYNLYNDCY